VAHTEKFFSEHNFFGTQHERRGAMSRRFCAGHLKNKK
jgi:hypothetical protein